MKVAVMQPYIFPYIGYFQMIKAVDTFVFYDDVNFIKKGWINRNKILVNNQENIFTVPLQKVSQNKLIVETQVHIELFQSWKMNYMKTIQTAYSKAPHYDDIKLLLEKVLNKDFISISDLAIESIVEASQYLNLNTKFIKSSEAYANRGLEKQARLIDICHKEKANHYINAIGGQALYKKEDFIAQGVTLDFIKSKPIQYKQFNNDFVPWLSIIDVLMFNSKEEIIVMLNEYELI